MSKEPIKFSPACTGFDREAFIATRIRQLRESPQDETYTRQKDNITLAIKLYESAKLLALQELQGQQHFSAYRTGSWLTSPFFFSAT